MHVYRCTRDTQTTQKTIPQREMSWEFGMSDFILYANVNANATYT